MKHQKFCVLALLLPMQLLAALPPTAESFRRLRAVLNSEEVYNTLGSANWVKSITESENGYLIQSEKCSLQVEVEATPPKPSNPPMIVIAPLKVKVGKLNCR